MQTDTTMVWLGNHSSAIEYFETLERADRLAVADPSVVTRTRASFDSSEERFGPYTDDIQVFGNVAIIPVQGTMRAKESWMSQMFGITTYDGIANQLAAIVADGGIDTVVMDVDSPGGEAKGLDSATDGIQAAIDAGLTVATHTSGQMASAAYWIGSKAQTVAASETAEVGSVGVIAVHGEHSKADAMEGNTYTVLRKGEYKALASPYEKLSEKAHAQILESMDRKYQQFISAVSEHRSLPSDFVTEKIANGKVYASSEAMNLGMIDEIVTYNDLVSRYVSADTPAAPGAGNSTWSETAMHKQPIVNASSLSPEEAAIAVAAGANPKDVLPTIKAEDDEQDSSEELAEVNVVEASDDESGEKTPESTGEAEGATAQAANPSELNSMVSSLNDQLVEAKVQLKGLESEVTALKAGNTGLRAIAIEQTQRLRVSLGQADDVSDLELMTDAALVTSHRHTLTQFMERFSTGATSRAPDQDTTSPSATVTRLHGAVKKATKI